jgi:hypothetical protein
VYHSGYGHTTNQANGVIDGAGTDESPTAGDIETAKAFGIRVASVALSL